MRSVPSLAAEHAEIEAAILGSTDDFVWTGIGNDGLGIMSAAELGPGQRDKPIRVFVKGSDPEDLYIVSTQEPRKLRDWRDFTRAFERREVIAATVTGTTRGGFSVDVGASAFMPLSRSGARGEIEAEQLIGKQIACRIVEVDPADDNIVVDRREILEAADLWSQQDALRELRPGARVKGTVCTLTDFGAFVDIGGVDGLLHVRDIAWQRVERPSDVLSVGQEIEVLVENVDLKRGRVGLSLKALQQDPWAAIGDSIKAGERIRGTVTTVTDFGVFVEVLPGVEGLVHQSDLSWSRTPIRPSEVMTPGETAEFVVLSVVPSERRIGLSRKQALQDPWKDIEQKYPVGAAVSGEITSVTEFGAFVNLNGPVEGMIHVSDMGRESVDHPRQILAPGQKVAAVVLECDSARRRLRLQLREESPVVAAPEVSPAEPQVYLDQSTRKNGEPDFSLYGKSIFLNFPAGKAHRIVGDAIAFTIIDCGLAPRFSQSGGEFGQLLSAVRECRYAVHELSEPFQAGFFAGCREFGADPHRLKQSLLLTAGDGGSLPGATALSYGNDPMEAMHLVYQWLEGFGAFALPGLAEIQARYQRFLQELPAICTRSGLSRADLTVPVWLRLAREWLLKSRR